MEVYRRLNDLIIFLCDETFQATTENLAKAMGVREQQVKADIDFLLNYEVQKGKYLFKPHINFTETDSGICYHMNSETAFGNDYKLLRLTPREFEYNKYYEAGNYSYYDLNYILKEIDGIEILDYDEYSWFSSDKVSDMERVIDASETIAYKRVSMKETDDGIEFTPHFIKRDMNTDELYVIEVDEVDGYITGEPIYAIHKYEIVPKGTDSRSKLSDEIRARVDSVWSFDGDTLYDIYENKEEATHLKLMIFDEDDMIERIRTDTFGRKRGSLTGPCSYGEDTVYYYEDDVLGLKPFKEWVKEFGESVIVLEPKELAYEIYHENCTL